MPTSTQSETVSVSIDSDADLDNERKADIMVPFSIVLRALGGVAMATKSTDDEMQPAIDAIQSAVAAANPNNTALNTKGDDEVALSLLEWHAQIVATASDDSARYRAHLALALAFLCHSGRHEINVNASDLDFTWRLVREALLSPSITFTVTRSAQGFLAVPLWSLVKDGNIEELFRFHVWLPDHKRGVSGFSVHSHQSFAESWILAGQGRNHSFDAKPADEQNATHAEYSISWSNSSGTQSGSAYQTHQKFSCVTNTRKFVNVRHEQDELHARNMSYTVPAGACHASEVAPDILHATLFLFDSSRGFKKDAPVLGPVDGESFIAQRDPAGVTPITLVGLVESVRAWETLYQQGLQHGYSSRWEEASQAYRGALHVCNSSPSFPDALHYEQAVLGQLGHVDKMLGRCEPMNTIASSNTAIPTTAVI